MLSFDVEDWFQVSRFGHVISRSDWESCELRVNENVEALLSILQKHRATATFFVLGWIAERVPQLVRRIHNDGHEIASHGYGHESLYHLCREDFAEDVRKSKDILDELTGGEVIGYRAPDFSIVDYVPDVLRMLGFRYDSSLFPTSFNKRYGRIVQEDIHPSISVAKIGNGLLEVPISTLDVFCRRVPWGGGGYFRFYPYRLFRTGIRIFLRQKTGYLFYGHPWDLDAAQPRVNSISFKNRVLHYSFLSSTRRKLARLLDDFEFTSIQEGLMKLRLL